jgi:hypothetical protein
VSARDHAASKTERDAFDLRTLGAGRRGRGITVEDTALTWQCAGQPRRRIFDDITTVRIGVDLISGDLPTADCDITFADGERLRLMMVAPTRKDMKYAEYREFVLRFFDRLDPAHGARIIFCAGPSAPIQAWWIIISGGCLALVLGVMVIGVFSGWVGQEGGWLFLSVFVLLAAAMAVWFVLTLQSGNDRRCGADAPAGQSMATVGHFGRIVWRSLIRPQSDRGP